MSGKITVRVSDATGVGTHGDDRADPRQQTLFD
jgi:hypothetical protein